MKPPLHFLHVFPSFCAAGSQTRAVAIMNYLRNEARHSIVALDGNLEAMRKIGPEVRRETVDPPRRGSLSAPFFFAGLLRKLKPDLLLTYNWGAIEAVAGAVLAGECRVVHAEDGFGPDETVRLKRRRVWARRILLRRAFAVAAPSRTLVRIALDQYRLPPGIVRYIPNGVDTARFAPRSGAGVRRSLGISDESLVIGYAGRLSAEKNLGLMLAAVAATGLEGAVALIVGDGPARRELESKAKGLAPAVRAVFAGKVEDTAPYYNAMDIFALSSLTEQMPMSLLEAMASGLPVVATAVGDVPLMLSAPQREFVLDPGDEPGYASALRKLGENGGLRATLGSENRRRAEKEYALEGMLEAYRRLYWEAAGKGREA